MFNLIGWPALTVPCGFVDGLPVGLQIAGRPGSEGLILRTARAFQVAYPQQQRPPL
jgi:Asp-tRNA(Asn)/Glu-tRNA(Gln) amidotransferase A subunit family amidase